VFPLGSFVLYVYLQKEALGMKNYKILSVVAVVGLIGACGGGRPNGEMAEGEVLITASATAAGLPLGAAGITASTTIEVIGTMSDRFGVDTSYYIWKDSGLLPLELGPEGGFRLELSLAAGDNELVLQGTSVVGDAVSTLNLIYTRDNEGPVVEPPTDEFAATITSEGEMEMEKSATVFSLSGGDPVAVKGGVSFSKFSTTWGEGQPNRPVWRFNVSDDYPLTDSSMQFRILHKDDEDEEELFVDWTPAVPGTDSDFELTISSVLDERLASVAGGYVLEVQAFDSAGNPSEIVRQGWRQAILNPPIFIEPGSEELMGTPGGPLDPRSYVIGTNFASLSDTSGVEIGSLRIGNPNNEPVLVRLTTLLDARGSYLYRRDTTAIVQAFGGPPGLPCGFASTYMGEDRCVGSQADVGISRRIRRELDPDNQNILFEIRDTGGNGLATGKVFVIPPNTVVHAIATLANPPGNLLESIEDGATHGPFRTNETFRSLGFFHRCTASTPQGGCANWDLDDDFQLLYQHFASWDFTSLAESKVNLDINDSTPWGVADPNTITGYSRVLSTSNGDSQFPPPTSHDDLSAF
jgi:hypothetical protein